MRTSRVPQELQDQIIENLPYNDLLEASLVSRSWCRHSRKILFRAVCVPAPFLGSTFEKFINENLFHARFVQSLTLSGVEDLKTQNDDDKETDEDSESLYEDDEESELAISISRADIASLLCVLPNLQVLELKDVSLAPSEVPLSDEVTQEFHLEELVLNHIVTGRRVEAEDSLLVILSLIDFARNLKLVDMPNRLVSVEDSPQSLIKDSVRLQANRCTVRDVKSCGVVLDLLRRGCSTSQLLAHLEVHTYATSDIRSLGNLLQSSGKQLQSLHLNISSSIRNIDFASTEAYIYPRIVDRALSPGLAACSSLHTCTLGIWLFVFADEPSNDNAWRCLAALISRLPASVRDLTIEIHGADDYILTQILDFGEVDRFTQPLSTWRHLGTLKKFKLHFFPRRSGETKRLYMATKYSLLTAPAFRTLKWSAEFDVEITAMTWVWRFDCDATPQLVKVPFDNRLPNLPPTMWELPYLEEDIDCYRGDLRPFVSIDVISDDEDEGSGSIRSK